MQVSVERTGPCEAKVSFTVPRAELEGEMRQQLRVAGRNVKMKGFRAGKVPARVLERHFGAEARQLALQAIFNRALQRAVKEEGLDTIGHERLSLDDIEIPEGEDFSHAFEVSLRPAVELGEYKGLTIESELEPVLDQEVAAALEDLRRQRARPEPAGEEGLGEDGMALCRITWVKEGDVLLEREGLRLSPLDQVPGVEPEAWRQALLGAREGTVLELPMTLPPDFEREELRGAAAVTRVELQQAFRMVPPSDEELQRLFEVSNAEELDEAVRRKIAEAKEARENGRIEVALFERVLNEHEIELPQRMLDAQIEGRRSTLASELEGQGQSAEEAAQEVERQSDDIRTAVERGARAYFLIQAIARAEQLEVESQDLVEELHSIARRNDATFEEVRDYYREHGLLEQVAVELLERKVRAFLREHAALVQPGRTP